MSSLNEELKAWREKNGINMETLSDIIGVSPYTIALWESCAIEISESLKPTIHSLIHSEEERKKKERERGPEIPCKECFDSKCFEGCFGEEPEEEELGYFDVDGSEDINPDLGVYKTFDVYKKRKHGFVPVIVSAIIIAGIVCYKKIKKEER